MKIRLLSTMCFILLTSTGFAQETFEKDSTQPATYTQVPTVPVQTSQTMNNSEKKRPADLSVLLADMEANNYTLYKRYKSGVKMVKYGRPLAIFGGCTFILGISGMLISEDIKNESRANNMFFYGYLSMVAGIYTLGAGIPIWVVGKNKSNRAIGNFSKHYYSSQSHLPYFQINMCKNRIGLAYVF